MELEGIRLSVYDCEVFAHDWLVVFKQDGAYRSIWNDNAALREHVDSRADEVFAGFNSKHYDQYILKAIYAGCTPEEVKEVNDHIIGGGQGWTHPYIADLPYRRRLYVHNTDLMDDVQKGTSLKSIEGHLGMSVEESSVPFDFEGALSEAQRGEVERYCRHDVDATERLLEIRWDYLETKLHLASLADIDPYRALGMTDPKLAAAFMGASPAEFDDERDYEFPDRLDYSIVPKDAVEFFGRIRDGSVPDEELFKSSLDAEIGGCPVKYGWGGVHGALPKFRRRAGDGTLLLNYDVASLYPSLMIEYGYVSRAVPDPQAFANVKAERIEAKRTDDKKTAKALKSPLNKGYGAMLNPYNDMYDPKMGRSVCISGQLSIAELAATYTRIAGLAIVQLNTDGVMVSVPEERYGEVLAANEWWQKQTSLELEEDRIEFVWQKDVNNYALRKTDGSEKVKGGYLARGIDSVGAWSINNNATIVAEALKRYLLDGTPVADTIRACDEPMRFQLIAKAGGKYSRVYQELFPEPGGEAGAETVERQKCNRVFATWDRKYGRLYKVKKADGSVAKVESLPEHCLIWNDDLEANPPPMSLIDKDYYIALAEKRARDFEKEAPMAATAGRQKAGTKEGEKPDYSKMNVYQKLALARKMVLDAGLKKTGVNNHLEFDFFELDDIVPTQTRVFEEVGLLEVFDESHIPESVTVTEKDGEVSTRTSKGSHYAIVSVYNVDDPDENPLVFKTDWAELAPIVSKKTGAESQNALQRKGSETTYLRRYSKLKVLDLTESDVDEARSGNPADVKEQAASATKAVARKTSTERAKSKPPTEAEKREVAEKVTKADGAANNLQVTQLKKALKALKEAHGDDPGVSSYIAEVGVQTKNLKDITKAQAEEAIRAIGEMKERLDTAGGEE